MFYYRTQYCNRVRMTCSIKRLLILSYIFKHADDTTLVVPENTNVDICDEFEHIKAWAVINNKLTLNLQKTKEIVFRRPRVSHFHKPSAMDDIEQLNCVKLLGVLLQDNLKMDSHVHFLISQCCQRMYLLKLLQHQGMPPDKLTVLLRTLSLYRLLCSPPSLGGFMSAELIGKVDAMLMRLKRFGYNYI